MTARDALSEKEICYRPAKPSDAQQASRLLFATFPKMATYIIGLGSENRARKILSRIFQIEGHRFSYSFAEVATHKGQIVGLFIAYPGKKLSKLNWQLSRVILGQYSLWGKLKLIVRGLPEIFIKETERDEFLLSNLAVKKQKRGQGIGEQILLYIEEKAKGAGYSKVSLMVSIENKGARRFYARNGYVVKEVFLNNNRSSSELGPGYQRMVKDLLA